MLPPGHAAGGFIAGTIAAFLTKRKSNDYSFYQIIGVAGGLLPDADLVIYHSLRNRFNLSPDIEHHTWLTHKFPFYLIPGTLLTAWAIRNKRPKLARITATLILGACTHLLQDMCGSGDGIQLLFPLSKRMFGFRLLDAHGKEWRRRYVRDPIFLVEATLIITALLIWLFGASRKRARK